MDEEDRAATPRLSERALFLAGLLVAAAGLAWALLAGEGGAPDALARARAVAALTPLGWVALACFHPRVLAALRAWPPARVALAAAVLVGWASLAAAERFDPYALAILGAAAAAATLAPAGAVRPGAVGAAVWLLLWMTLDLRAYAPGRLDLGDRQAGLWLGPRDLGYAAWALGVSALAILGFGVNGRQDVGLAPPRPRDALIGVGALLAFGALAIPIGVAVRFVHPHLEPALGPTAALLTFVGLALTVALPEELFFRGLLDRWLSAALRRRWLSLLLSSLAFGLMHWNNRRGLEAQLAYLALATVAGVFYGLAFRRSGGLTAPVLAHTLVDLVWQVWLRKPEG